MVYWSGKGGELLDKSSENVLKFISEKGGQATDKMIRERFGEKADASLQFLQEKGFVLSRKEYSGINSFGRPVTTGATYYVCQPAGNAYLEEIVGKRVDRWITRIAAIVGAVTGVVSLLLHFL